DEPSEVPTEGGLVGIEPLGDSQWGCGARLLEDHEKCELANREPEWSERPVEEARHDPGQAPHPQGETLFHDRLGGGFGRHKLDIQPNRGFVKSVESPPHFAGKRLPVSTSERSRSATEEQPRSLRVRKRSVFNISIARETPASPEAARPYAYARPT